MAVKITVVGDVNLKQLEKAERQIQQFKREAEKSSGSVKGAFYKMQDGAKGFITAMAPAAVAIGVAGAAAAGFASKAVNAFIESEKSAARLRQTIENLGGTYQSTLKSADAFIQRQSLIAAVDDELVSDTLTLLLQATKDYAEAQRLTALALDISAARGLEATTVAKALGKAYNGQTTALGRMGVSIDKTASTQEVLNQLMADFSGQAEEFGNTAAGAFERAKVAQENFWEAAGSGIAKQAEADLTGWTVALNALQTGGFKGLADTIKRTNAVAAEYDKTTNRLRVQVHDGTITMEEFNQAMDEARGAYVKGLIGTQNATKAKAEETKKTADLVTQEKRLADAIKTRNREQYETTNTELAMLNAQARVEDAEKSLTSAIREHGKGSREARIASLELKIARHEAGVAAREYKKSVDEARDADKKAASEKAIMNKLAQVRQAWLKAANAASSYRTEAQRSLKVPTGGHVSGGVRADAVGGIVFPTPGGSLHRIGEAGSAEAVIPLNSTARAYELLAYTMERMGVSGGGATIMPGAVNVTIGGTNASAAQIEASVERALRRVVRSSGQLSTGRV